MTIKKLLILFICFLIGGKITAQLPYQIDNRVSDTARIKQWLDSGGVYLFRPGSEQKDIDSSLYYFNKALELSRLIHNKNWELASLKLKADSYLENAKLREGITTFMEVIRYYQSVKDLKEEAAAWDRLGECITVANPVFINAKISCYRHAYLLHQQTKNTVGEFESLQNIVLGHFNLDSLDLALREMLIVIDGLKKVPKYPALANCYNLLADLYQYKGALHSELLNRLEGIRWLERYPDNNLSANFFNNLGQNYVRLGKYENADIYYKKGLAASITNNNYESFFTVLLCNIKCMILQKKPAESLQFLKQSIAKVPPVGYDQKLPALLAYANCYRALRQYEKAEQYYKEVLSIEKDRYQRQILSIINYSRDLEEVAGFYTGIQQYKKAEEIIAQLRALPIDVISQTANSNIHLMQFKIDSAAHNYLSAIRHFETHKILQDSMLNAAKSEQIAELEIQYETEKKDKDIQLKINNIQQLEKHSQVQDVRFKQQAIIRNLIIAGAVLLLLLLAITYNRFKLKQKNNLLLQSQQKEINEQNQVLQSLNVSQTTLLKEKEWLLREIHHRVKNNLQITISLLNIQSAYLENQQALNAIQDSQRRMHSMSLIHQKLYRSENLAYIDMSEYIPELVSFLRDSFLDEKGIQFELQIEPIMLNVSQAVPLGLILNEAITNAIKYAFPGDSKGRISITLFQDEKEINSLTISDNGVGLPVNFDTKPGSSLGLNLIRGLTHQIQGEFTIESNEGTTVTIRFKDLKILVDEFTGGRYAAAF